MIAVGSAERKTRKEIVLFPLQTLNGVFVQLSALRLSYLLKCIVDLDEWL